MKKVVAFMGSPRKEGNTAAVVGEVVRGAKEAGAEVKLYNLNDMNIRPCQGCLYCRANEGCAVKDDMQAVYADIKGADAVVIGSPVYMFQVSAQTKLLMDRLFPLMDAKFKPRYGIKKTVTVHSQGNPDAAAFKAAWDANAQVMRVGGLEVVDAIIVAGANDSKTAAGNGELLARAYRAGRDLVR